MWRTLNLEYITYFKNLFCTHSSIIALCTVLQKQIIELYSRINLTCVQYSVLRGDANLNSDGTRLINHTILSNLHQAHSIYKLLLCVGQKKDLDR